MRPLQFQDLQCRLVEILRWRIRNGHLTERGLARLAGVSQPHMHNIMKGVRSFSPQLADRLLSCLRLTVLDLIDNRAMQEYLADESITKGELELPAAPSPLLVPMPQFAVERKH